MLVKCRIIICLLIAGMLVMSSCKILDEASQNTDNITSAASDSLQDVLNSTEEKDSSSEADNSDDSQTTSSGYEDKIHLSKKTIKPSFSEIDGDDYIVFFLNDGFIFSDNKILYRYYFSDGKTVKLGDFDFNFTDFNGKLIGDKLYFYSCGKENQLGVIDLYQIDISKNTVSKLKTEEHYNTLIPTAVCSRGLITFKGDMNGDETIGHTYVDIYNSSSNTFEKVVSYTLDRKGRTGEFIKLFDCSEDVIYVLVSDFDNHFYLDSYNLDGKIIKRYEISEIDRLDGVYLDAADSAVTNGFEYFLASTSSSMKIVGDYVFLDNMSNQTIVFKLQDDKMVPFSDLIENFYSASYKNCVYETSSMFFMYNVLQEDDECQLYKFDSQSGSYEKIDLTGMVDGESTPTNFYINEKSELLLTTCENWNDIDKEQIEHFYVVDPKA